MSDKVVAELRTSLNRLMTPGEQHDLYVLWYCVGPNMIGTALKQASKEYNDIREQQGMHRYDKNLDKLIRDPV